INIDLAEQTRKILTTLTSREEKVLRMRFGISDRSNFLTREEISSMETVEKIDEVAEVAELMEPQELNTAGVKEKGKDKKRFAKH
ncbi:MAG: hypothetical protein LLG40_00205, partial [Deltaproteobacteria bacterium]|nr:hypothetical protein [Deltaproteobacteria bacterium]